MKPNLPIYHRPPQKFIKYTEANFEDAVGNKAIIRTAHYLDKKGNPQEMVAQVIWYD